MSKKRLVGPSAWVFGAAGAIIGVVAALLVSQGNPGNMGLCIACFLRDTTGFFGGAKANMGAVAYIRPEIIGLVMGATATALATKEFRPRGGSGMAYRFVLGFIFMMSALIFLGCTVRAWLRLGGGDLNALWGVLGIIAGVAVGSVFLKRGFNLGRAGSIAKPLGWIAPAIFIVLLALAAVAAFGSTPEGFTVTAAKAVNDLGKPLPGGLRAPFVLSLVAGLSLGVVAQRSRFCSIGGIRDAILVKRFDLLFGVLGLLLGAFVANLVFGQFNLGFAGQPVAHTDALGNFAAMAVAGLAAVMLGGCPFRQVIMSGEGDADAFVAVVGMIVGALAAHWFGIASSAKGLSTLGWPALGVMAVVLVAIALIKRDRAA
ncbi:MAG: YedE family putative selenium transporter [Coriobacteriia bacterium]